MKKMKLVQKCLCEENLLQFDRFNQNDALKLGIMLSEKAQKYDKAVAIEININGLTVFRFFPNGTNRNNEMWLTAKRNTVDLLGISSLHLFAELLEMGETLNDKRMDEKQYAQFGGGFPLIVRGTSVIGSICVSGLMHLDDHQVIVDALTEYLKL